ncbi:DUF4430 domain-containing protein [Candidatus Nomurabacteria bacterium]|nr:DUF4430 domain-containing protein [Candidatus Nomurabacteria bacterium]
MPKNQKKYTENFIKILSCALILIVVVFFFIPKQDGKVTILVKETITNSQPQIKISSPKTNDKPKTETAKLVIENTHSVTVLAGETTARLLFSPNTLFYDALIQAQNKGQMSFSGKNYPGLGFFVTEIGTLRAGNGKNLLYYINEKEASVGVSSYTLKDGDIIEWKLE